MPFYGSVLRSLSRNRAIASGAGFLLARAAFKGNVFAQLASLWLGSEYLEQRKQDNARAAARLAAIQVGKNDPACRDPQSAECLDHAKSAAIAAGVSAMRGPGFLRKLGCYLFAVGTIATAVHGDLGPAAINAALFVACAWPWFRG